MPALLPGMLAAKALLILGRGITLFFLRKPSMDKDGGVAPESNFCYFHDLGMFNLLVPR